MVQELDNAIGKETQSSPLMINLIFHFSVRIPIATEAVDIKFSGLGTWIEKISSQLVSRCPKSNVVKRGLYPTGEAVKIGHNF